MAEARSNDCIVVGAGLSGLAAAHALAARGVRVTLLEARDRVAEPWRARHPQLRLNIHRKFAGLPGRSATRRDGAYLRRDTLIDYLERYAAELGASIEFGVSVLAIRRSETGWHLQTSHGPRDAANIVIATGRDTVPHLPEWPGRDEFSGELLHVADLGDVRRFSGRKVLVVGAGNSGSDALNHLARVDTAALWVSVRHGPAIMPARLLGFSMHRLARLFLLMSDGMADRALALTQRLVYGDLTRFGLPHRADGGSRLAQAGITPAIDDGFVDAIKAGAIEVVPEIRAFDGNLVRLRDGRELSPDVVICATGYRSGLEPLLGHLDVLDARGHPSSPMGEADRRHPGLWFAGYKPIFTGYFDAARIAAERIGDGIVARTPASREAIAPVPRVQDRAA